MKGEYPKRTADLSEKGSAKAGQVFLLAAQGDNFLHHTCPAAILQGTKGNYDRNFTSSFSLAMLY
jgi:hypothetical protein